MKQQLYDYGGGNYYAPKCKRGNTVRRLCPSCFDEFRLTREIPLQSKTGLCDDCAAIRAECLAELTA